MVDADRMLAASATIGVTAKKVETMQLVKVVITVLGLLFTVSVHSIQCMAWESDIADNSNLKKTEQTKNSGFPSLIKSETLIESDDAELPTETIIDLGHQLCNTEVRIHWTIVNKSKQSIDWPRMTASCGCISGVSSSMGLLMNESKQMEITIKLPRSSESLTKQVTFWDANGNGRCQATIKSNVITPLKIEEAVLDVSDEKKHWKSIAVTASHESIDLRKLSVTAFGAELVGSELKSEDGRKGVLRIELDPSQTAPPSIRSTFTFEVTLDGAYRGSGTVPIRFIARTVTLPEPVYFRLVGKEYQAQVRVWSFPLAAELSKASEFVVTATSDASKKLGSTFEIQIEPPNGKGPTCTVTLRHVAPKSGSKDRRERLRLKCGDWERVIECRWE